MIGSLFTIITMTYILVGLWSCPDAGSFEAYDKYVWSVRYPSQTVSILNILTDLQIKEFEIVHHFDIILMILNSLTTHTQNLYSVINHVTVPATVPTIFGSHHFCLLMTKCPCDKFHSIAWSIVHAYFQKVSDFMHLDIN